MATARERLDKAIQELQEKSQEAKALRKLARQEAKTEYRVWAEVANGDGAIATIGIATVPSLLVSERRAKDFYSEVLCEEGYTCSVFSEPLDGRTGAVKVI